MVCIKCAAKNTRTAKYCGRCGHPFPRAAERGRVSGAAGRGGAVDCSADHPIDCEEGRTISFDFRAMDAGWDGVFGFGEPPRRDRDSRLRESYISLLERSVPETFGVFSPSELPEGKEGEWGDVVAPPSTPWALEREYQSAAPSVREAEDMFEWPAASGASATQTEVPRLIGWLVTFSHRPEGEDFRLHAARLLIGSSPQCDIMIRDEAISRVHASITYRDGRCYLKDEQSRGGIFVNGAALAGECALESHDEIQLGQTVLKFIAVDPTPRAAQSAQAAD